MKISSYFVQEMQARRRTSSSHKESHEEVPSEVEEGEKRDKKMKFLDQRRSVAADLPV